MARIYLLYLFGSLVGKNVALNGEIIRQKLFQRSVIKTVCESEGRSSVTDEGILA